MTDRQTQSILAQTWANLNSSKHSRHPEFISAGTPTLFSKLDTSPRKQEAGSNPLTNQTKSEKHSTISLQSFVKNNSFIRLLQNWKLIAKIRNFIFRNDVNREGFIPTFERKNFNLFSHSAFNQNAFTLAEVLITLGVIGVIAVLVLPGVITKTQNDTCLNQLKKFTSDFNQALKLMANDYGCPEDLACTGVFGQSNYRSSSINVMQVLSKYIKTDKICGPQAPYAYNSANCFPYSGYRLLNGTTATISNFYEGYSYNDRAWATLQNGTYYGILDNTAGQGTPCTNYAVNYCGLVYVDVNGNNPPNQVGRDVFYFNIMPNAVLKPSRGQGGVCDSTADCNTSDTGKSCACKIIQDSWRMNY